MVLPVLSGIKGIHSIVFLLNHYRLLDLDLKGASLARIGSCQILSNGLK
jgi:hypothetical protein